MRKKSYLSLVLCAILGATALPASAVSESVHATAEVAPPAAPQGKKISGKVVDEAGNPVAFASVQVKGTSVGTNTDANGKYTLTVKPGSTLLIKFIGYQQAQVAVTAANVYNITLKEDSKALTEVVVTAMGIKKEKKSLGYSVSDINSEELMKNKQTNVVNSLAGKVAGVNVTQAGGAAGSGSTIILRGGNSADESRDNQPLFVVDGVIYDNSTVNTGNSGTDGVTKGNTTFSNRVMDLNPEDIESMTVLKGAAAAALYGSRAGDGAIIITTKKGEQGTVKVNFSSKVSTSWANRLPEYQKVYGRGYYNEIGTFSDYSTQSWGEKFSESAELNKYYNNVENFFQNGTIFDNSVSISGGSKNGTFFLSASDFNQEGIVPNTGYDKKTFRFNGEQKYGKLTAGINVAYTSATTDKTLTSGGLYGQGGNGALSAVYGWSQSDDMRHWLNEDGSKYRMFADRQDLEDDVENPYWIINKNKLQDATDRLTGNINASFQITNWWTVSGRLGIDRYKTSADTYTAPGGAVKQMYQGGYLARSERDYRYLSTTLLSTMNKQFGDFDLNLTLGHTTEYTKTSAYSHWGYNFIVPGTASFNNIPTTTQFFKNSNSRKRLVGAFGEFRATWKNMLYLTVTGRNDWTSTLPSNSYSYFYPSVSGAFAFTELMPKNDILNFGKVRASYAKVGKDTYSYLTNSYLWPVTTFNGGKPGVGNSWTGGAPNLKPEMQNAYELGLELHFLKNRLTFDYTYYYTKTTNQLCSPRLAQSTGYIFLQLNGGSVINRGMEFMISGTPVLTKKFKWESSLNFSFNNGTLGNFIDGVTTFYPTDAQQGTVKAGAVPNGGHFLSLTGYTWQSPTVTDAGGNKTVRKGVYIVDRSTGVYKQSTTADAVVGNREPDLIGGWNNTFSYKNFSLSFLLDFRLGGDIYNGTEYYLTQRGLSKNTLQRDKVTLKNVIWSDDPTDATPQDITYEANKMYTIGTGSSAREVSGKYLIQQYYSSYCSNSYNFIKSVNWLKLRSVTLSYDFSSLIKNQKVIKGLVASVTATNLFTITNYKGLDPEVCSAGSGTGGSGSVGIDYLGVPSTSSLSFGVNITF